MIKNGNSALFKGKIKILINGANYAPLSTKSGRSMCSQDLILKWIHSQRNTETIFILRAIKNSHSKYQSPKQRRTKNQKSKKKNNK